MNRKIILLLLFVFLTSLNNSNAIDSTELDTTNSTNRYENISEGENNFEEKKEIKNKFFSDKSALKKEISNRRKYHRNLLYIYNENFNKNHLDLITQNGMYINDLENHYKLNFLEN